jgi:N,N'-diacetylchitobiose transport system permease protein
VRAGPGAELSPSSAGLPNALAAETAARPSRRRSRERILRAAVPYALLSPATLVIGAVLAYPLYFLVKLSFQRYGLAELIRHEGRWTGVDNYTAILHDALFWRVLLRTVLFSAAVVALTMVLGTLIALLLARLGSFMRLLLTTGLVLVWAMPVVVAVNIWQWMVDYEFGVANWLLTEIGLGDFNHHDWFADPLTGLAVIGALIVWGAIPFVAITLYAGLSQVPQELVEAASIDGAGPWRVFRDVTFPILKPIFVILASLSVIWDFQVFIQVWIMRDGRPTEDYYVMSIYAFVKSFGVSQYGLGSAIALVMVLFMLVATFVYIRQMVKIGEAE